MIAKSNKLKNKNKIKVYIASPLCVKEDRDFAEKLDSLCKELGLETFLPHRDCGLWKEGVSFEKIAKGDIEGFKNCKLLVANLNGFNIGAGTAWEMGYAHARGIPIIAIKTDRKLKDSVEEVSAIIMGLTKIVSSFEDLKREVERVLKV
ncbi:MAG: nucleoside 2-deoxyribosyltransferase [Candidatus Pacearchaeota archaeon]|jgi:nucleoside 2-deoxyribosyltransferase